MGIERKGKRKEYHVAQSQNHDYQVHANNHHHDGYYAQDHMAMLENH
jgi:hypothetical protein